MTKRYSRLPVASVAIALGLVLFVVSPARAQKSSAQSGESDPAAALTDALVAACRANETQFSGFLAGDNGAAFLALPEPQRVALMKRLSLSDSAGKPLISNDNQNRTVLRCRAAETTVEFRFGTPRTHENLAFIPVTVVDGAQADFGLVREAGSWRLLSLGLVLFDIPQLAKEWEAQDLAAHEEATVAALRELADAIQTYRRAFGKLPESLAELGPAPKDQISPEQASLVSADLAAGKHDGYVFRYRIAPDANGNDGAFELAATPEAYGRAGRRSFFMDAAGKVHGDDKHGAVSTYEDPLIAGEKTETEKSE
jgi:type II secretory pathway pseudopilin PulG